MHGIIIEEPYEFVPPVYSDWWPALIQYYLPRYMRKKYGIHSVECRDVEKLQQEGRQQIKELGQKVQGKIDSTAQKVSAKLMSS